MTTSRNSHQKAGGSPAGRPPAHYLPTVALITSASLPGPISPQLLEVLTSLSRKLAWAIRTSWEDGSFERPSTGVINSLVSQHAFQIVTQLADKYPLWVWPHLQATPPEPDNPAARD